MAYYIIKCNLLILKYFAEGLLVVCSKTFVKIQQLKKSNRPPAVRREQDKKNKLLKHYWTLLKDKKIGVALFLVYCANIVGKRTFEYLER